MADMRDYRNQWKQLQESWAKEDTEVNVSATKKEKLEEGKRKLPDALKAHQFKKKGAEEQKEASKVEEKEDDKKEDKTEGKTIFGKKATEGKKPTMGWTHAHAKQKVVDAEKKKRQEEKAKKATEDAAPGSAGGATVSAPGAGDPAEGTGPTGIARFPERLGCKPGQKCKTKPQQRTFPEKVTTKESKGKRLFNHFRKFMEAEGLNLDQVTPEVTPEVAPEAEVPEMDVEPGLDNVGQDAPPEAGLIADLQAKFPGAKITVTIEAGEVPFDAETVAKAQEVAETIPVESDIEDIGGEEDLGASETGVPGAEGLGDVGGEELPVPQEESATSELDLVIQDAADYAAGLGGEVNGQVISQFVLKHYPSDIDKIDMIVQGVKERLNGIGESIVMGEEGDEVTADVPEMEVGGEAGAEAGEMGDVGMGDLEAGAEDVAAEISSDSIALSPEQWEAFLAGGTEEEPVDDMVGGDAEQEESPETGEHKSADPASI